MPLSEKQMTYLALAWQCFDAEPKIDYDKFKDIAGLASANSARELMRVTKNKLKSEYGALGASVRDSKVSPAKKEVSAPVATPKSSGVKRGRPVKAVDYGEKSDDEEEHTPAKKMSTSPSKNARAGKENGKVKAEPIADSDAEEEFIFS